MSGDAFIHYQNQVWHLLDTCLVLSHYLNQSWLLSIPHKKHCNSETCRQFFLWNAFENDQGFLFTQISGHSLIKILEVLNISELQDNLYDWCEFHMPLTHIRSKCPVTKFGQQKSWNISKMLAILFRPQYVKCIIYLHPLHATLGPSLWSLITPSRIAHLPTSLQYLHWKYTTKKNPSLFIPVILLSHFDQYLRS